VSPDFPGFLSPDLPDLHVNNWYCVPGFLCPRILPGFLPGFPGFPRLSDFPDLVPGFSQLAFTREQLREVAKDWYPNAYRGDQSIAQQNACLGLPGGL